MLHFVSWRSLRTKIIAWSFVPTAIILLAVALVAFYAYQQVTEDLVVGRNRELTRLSAGQLASGMAEYTDLLGGLAKIADVYDGQPELQRAALAQARNRLLVFDAGAVMIDGHGQVVASEPNRPEVIGQDWSNRDYFRQILRSPTVVFSSIVTDGPGGAEVIVLAVPITGPQGQFRGTLAGMFRLGATSVSAFYGGIVKLRVGESGDTYLVDGNGRVIFHPETDLIGRDISSQLVVRQVLARKVGELRTRDIQGRDIVASYAPVPGTPWGLINEESWDALMSSSRGYREFLMLLLVLGVVIPALVVTAGVRRIIDPIARLIGAAQEVAQGNFGRTISVDTGDELEDLAKQFNLMSAQLKESYSDLERKVADRTRDLADLAAENARLFEAEQRRAEQFRVIAEVGRRITSILTLDALLSEIARLVRDSLGYRMVSIGLIEGDEVVFKAESGSWQEAAGMPAVRLRIGEEGICGRVAQTGEPMLVGDVGRDPHYLRLPENVGTRSELAVPLKAQDRVIGVLDVESDRVDAFDESDLAVLQTLAYQAAVSIENARLYEQAKRLAVVEERNRLARDLHDSVTQAVYGVTLYAEAASRLLSAGRVEMAAEHLSDLRSTAQQALREMRSLIFELRPPVLEREGLVAAIQSRLEAVEQRAGVRAELLVEGEAAVPAVLEDGLYRIALEALNNALKHSGASDVRVMLRRGDGSVILEVADNGAGFDTSAARDHGGMGLRGMEERATRLGGSLMVESRPGKGTTIRVEVCR